MVAGVEMLHSNHAEFIPSDYLSCEEYKMQQQQRGGCFVTTKTALFFVFLSISSIVLAVALMYFYGPNTNKNQEKEELDIFQKLMLSQKGTTEYIRRLPKALQPLQYKLQIHPNLEQRSAFKATVDILLLCVAKTAEIVVNIEDLHINPFTLKVVRMKTPIKTDDTGNSQILMENVGVKNQQYDKYKFTYKITLASDLEQNANYTVHIEFIGKISDNFVGLYKTNYKSKTNQSEWLMATNLQPYNARRVFPCLDDPSVKASFEISIARRTNVTAISNMPLVESTPVVNATGWVWDHFEKSPPMPAYLVSFIICDCEVLTTNASAGTVLRTWAVSQRHIKDNGSFAQMSAMWILQFLENYFNIRFPLPKLDFVAIPNLEQTTVNNWGLVYFRDSSLLLEDKALQQHLFQTIARQISLQWFGDLVSVDSFTNSWLSEGFALFISEVALREQNLTSQIYGTFLTETLEVLHDEALQPTSLGDVAYQRDDDISYKKAASLIRMLFHSASQDVFRKVVGQFLKKWSYKSASPADLWNIFENHLSNNFTVNEFMETWIMQAGYPLIDVNFVYQNHTMYVVQKAMDESNNHQRGGKWLIPIDYFSSNAKTVAHLWLANQTTHITQLTDAENNTWVLFNLNQTGLYRVKYNLRNWLLLQGQLDIDLNKIPVNNRAQIVNDALELAALDKLDYDVALNISKYLIHEDSYEPWAAGFQSFRDIGIVLANTHYQEIFKKYLVHLTTKIIKRLGSEEHENEQYADKHLRSLIHRNLCDVQYEACIDWAKQLYDKWMNSSDGKLIPYNIRETVQCTALNAGGQKEWEFLWRHTLSQNTTASDLKISYLSLGCSRQSWLIHKYLELSLQGNVSIEYIPYVWKSLVHPAGINTGFKFLRSNWQRIRHTYSNNPHVLKAIIESLLSRLSTNVDLEDLTTFCKKEEASLRDVAPVLLSAVNKIKFRIRWSSQHLKKVVEWMKKNLV